MGLIIIQFPLYRTHPVMSHLQILELCGSIKKAIWELGQLVTMEIPIKKDPKWEHQFIINALVKPVLRGEQKEQEWR